MKRTASSAVSGISPTGLHEYLGGLLQAAWKDYQRSFGKCREKFSEESVHQLRVGSRKLLALIGLLETVIGRAATEPGRLRIRKMLRRLARLRDIQVQLLYIESAVKPFPEAQQFFEFLQRRERRQIRRDGARLRRTRLRGLKIEVRRVRMEIDRVLADKQQETHQWDIILRAVNRAFRQVSEMRDRCQASDPRTVHRMRIGFKRFRYMVELLQPIVPGIRRGQLKDLHVFQGKLGEIQDADVLARTLDQFCRKRPDQAEVLGNFRNDVERRRRQLTRKFLASANVLHEFWPPRGRQLQTPAAAPKG